MRIGAVITIAADHDARNAASRPTASVPDRSCRATIPALGGGDTMKASDVKAAGPPSLTPAWCCRWPSRHGAAARTPQALQLACTRRCLRVTA
jgi:hypothetical protein